MTDFEKLGLFYLGRTSEGPYLLDARDLTTHAVCVGMTGSGKTGLCLALLEEAAIDGIPVIAIDPKGDVGNLCLTFPALDAASFAPWVNADDAARAGLTVEAFAAKEADTWRAGLAGWGQDGDRITRLREAAEVAVYTPGSRAGRPLSILNSLAAPPPIIRDDEELLSERVSGTAGSLLSLLGITADPLTSRDHILLATILQDAWQNGRSLDLAGLIHAVQTPGVTRVGVMDLEAFYPQKDRFLLAARMNNLLASPGFSAWLEGDALDIGRLLHDDTGRPRTSIVSIAHLDDAQRMFVVSLLLGEIVTWMRTQSGTTSLRALIYMDEVFGYLPPVANPPSKGPMLTLLKQARAFGVGVCLATQNPVDLDYKALSNTGTWLIGRLQTDRDRARLLDGLEGAGGGAFDRAAAETQIAALGKRRFFVHSVHTARPVEIESRWCLSYLRGPMTRDDLRRLGPGVIRDVPSTVMPTAAAAAPSQTAARPLLPPVVPQFFAPSRGSGPWTPWLYGTADLDFADARRRIEASRRVAMALPLSASTTLVDWSEAVPCEVDPRDLVKEPDSGDQFAAVPPQVLQTGTFAAWTRDFERWLSRHQSLELLRHGASGAVSRPDEDARAFRIRVQEVVRAGRDAAIDKVRTKYASKLATAAEKVRRLELTLAKEEQDVQQHRVQAGLSTAGTVGAAVLGAIFGRRGGVTAGTLGKASTTARSWARGSKEAEDVKRAQQNLAAAREALASLEAEITGAVEAVETGHGPTQAQELESIAIAPARGGVHVKLVALVWMRQA